MKQKILVLEDEQRAGEKLIDLINKYSLDATVIWKRTVSDGLLFLKEHKDFDLIFSDIELLDGNAFKIYDVFQPNCPIIFCTAYNEFYVDAFSTNGIAYLLKPYTKEQFESAWNKYIKLFGAGENQEFGISTEVIDKLKSIVDENNITYKRTFSVKKREGVFLLKTSEISYFQAQGDFVLAIDNQARKHILNYTLTAIEESLNPKYFFRINRSEIIGITNIIKYSLYTKNRLAIQLSKPKITLYTSNSRAPEFKSWLENN